MKQVPERKKIGNLGEDLLEETIAWAGFSAEKSVGLDHCKVDLLVPRRNGRPLRRPLEFQITRRRDVAQKIREYLKAPPTQPNAIRIYVEMATHELPRENIRRDLALLIIGWAQRPPDSPRFLRLSKTDSIYTSLEARLKRLEELLVPSHPDRLDAIIVGLRKKDLEIRDERGRTHVVPYGALQDPDWNRWLQSCYKAQAIKAGPNCGVSLLLNHQDRDGHVIYAALRKPAAYDRLWPAYAAQAR